MDYVMELGDLAFIDAYSFGSPARFINNSHDPNVNYDEWHCAGKKKVLICSCRVIIASPEHPVELLAAYGWILDPEDDRSLINQYPCYCGAASCTGSLYSYNIRDNSSNEDIDIGNESIDSAYY